MAKSHRKEPFGSKTSLARHELSGFDEERKRRHNPCSKPIKTQLCLGFLLNDRDPKTWMEEYCLSKNWDLDKYKDENFIPLDVDLSFDNCDEFIRERKKLIKDKLLKTLKG